MRPDLLAQSAATLALCGLIWTVQVVHYPLFARVGEAAFRGYHEAHTRLMTIVVAPLMAVELGTALWWIASPVPGVTPAAAWIGLALVLVCWLSTAFIQVPQHRRLAVGFDAPTHRALVRSNWIRTVAWTARGALCLWLLGTLVA